MTATLARLPAPVYNLLRSKSRGIDPAALRRGMLRYIAAIQKTNQPHEHWAADCHFCDQATILLREAALSLGEFGLEPDDLALIRRCVPPTPRPTQMRAEAAA